VLLNELFTLDRVKQEFDQAGIQIGIPQQKLYMNRFQNLINSNSNHQDNHYSSTSSSN
jgi:hypothetical protein